ncbi:S19A3-like protein, partial [Mya arenaria]
MLPWKLLTALVCAFGFFKDLRPSEAYLTVDNEIYPWWTYSYLLWMVPVFLLTDYFRYKPTLVGVGIAYIVTWALLLWAQGVPAMKAMQMTFGLGTACEISYFSYIFAVVPGDYFQKVSSFTRAASLAGKFIAYLWGQLLTYYNVLNYFQLNIFSFVSVCIAFLISLLLPRSEYSELFNPKRFVDEEEEKTNNPQAPSTDQTKDDSGDIEPCSGLNVTEKTISLLKFLFLEAKSAYSNKTVQIWSIWWALAACGNFQVANYVQNLWDILSPYHNYNPRKHHIYNGAVEAAGTLLSSCAVLAVGFLPVNWSVPGRCELVTTVICGLNAIFLLIMSQTSSIWVCYVLYDLFRSTYQIVLVIAAAQIASALTRKRYGFVFGCNTFVALLVESILTAIVVDKAGLDVKVRTQ